MYTIVISVFSFAPTSQGISKKIVSRINRHTELTQCGRNNWWAAKSGVLSAVGAGRGALSVLTAEVRRGGARQREELCEAGSILDAGARPSRSPTTEYAALLQSSTAVLHAMAPFHLKMPMLGALVPTFGKCRPRAVSGPAPGRPPFL